MRAIESMQERVYIYTYRDGKKCYIMDRQYEKVFTYGYAQQLIYDMATIGVVLYTEDLK